MEAVLRYSPGGIFSYSAEADEQFSYLSDNMLFFLGYTKEEFEKKFDNRFSLMNAHLSKPIDPGLLCDTLRRLIYKTAG